jgi:hypothetical protein
MMRSTLRIAVAVTAMFATVNLLVASGTAPVRAQELEKSEFYQATARGQAQQLGRTFSVNIRINEYSSPEDQAALLEAFTKGGMRGLSNALGKMSSKGRLSITGTLGYDISYIRQFPTPNGRKIRIVTNRVIRFGEAWWDSRSSDYSLSAIELEVNNEGEGTGTLLPACRFKINKEKELQIELLRNAWKLINVKAR